MEVCDRKKLGKGNEELFWIIILNTDILVWNGYLKGDIFGIFLKDNIKRVLRDGVLTQKYEYLNSVTHLPWDPGRECVQDKHGRAKLRESSVLTGVRLSALVPTCLEIEWMPWRALSSGVCPKGLGHGLAAVCILLTFLGQNPSSWHSWDDLKMRAFKFTWLRKEHVRSSHRTFCSSLCSRPCLFIQHIFIAYLFWSISMMASGV